MLNNVTDRENPSIFLRKYLCTDSVMNINSRNSSIYKHMSE